MSRLRFVCSVHNNMRVLTRNNWNWKKETMMGSATRTIIFLMWITFGISTLVYAGKWHFVVHLKTELILATKIEIGIIACLISYLYIVDRLKHLDAFFTSLFLNVGISCHRNEKLKYLRHLRLYSDRRIKNVA